MACDDWKQEQDTLRGKWVETRRYECTKEEDQGYYRCDKEEDQGYYRCDQEEDQGHNECCDWWPCSWLCDAWVWVSHIVCIVSTWVSHVVCVASTWIKNIVCIAGTWIVDKTWQAGTWIGWGACKVYENIILPVIKWFIEITIKVIDWILGSSTSVEDIVPDFSRVNFDRRDGEGNLIPFIWGASTASHQVEGNITSSDWHHFTSSPMIKRRVENVSKNDTTLRIEPPGRAVDHWNLSVLEADLDRAKLLGMNSYRFSLEWSRIQPQKPDWADKYISSRRLAEDASIKALFLRNEAERARQSGDDARAQQLEAEASGQEQIAEKARSDAETFADPPFDPNEYETAPIEQYKKMIERMKDRGLIVILTLNHMSLPDWVLTPPVEHDIIELSAVEDEPFRNSLRGWENPVTTKAYENFVRFVVPHFKDLVSYWITLNEPVGSSMATGYMAGVWPPGFVGDGKRALKVYFNFIDAHVSAYAAIKEIAGDSAQVGVSHIVMYARRAEQTFLQRIGQQFLGGDNEAAKNQWAYAFNYYFLDALVKGDFNKEIWRKDKLEHKEEWTGKLDFIAPQYYRAVEVYHDILIAFAAPWFGGRFVADLRKTIDDFLSKYLWNDMGWTIYPGGLYQILKDFHDRYKLPLLLTENGMAESEDRNRAAYIIAHLQQVLRAIKDGVNVIGYVHWSIVDNWEWAFGYQEDARFGLFTVDRTADLSESKESSFPRHITEGALGYQYVMTNSRRITEMNSSENPFDAPVARFGTIAPNGLKVQAPEQLPGALWEGSFQETGSVFMLYLSRLPADWWLGMIFFQDNHQWLPLQDINWHSEESGNGTLKFRYPAKGTPGVFVEYVAATLNSQQPGIYTPMQGTVTVGEGPLKWSAQRVVKTGIWKHSREKVKAPAIYIAINRLEGDYDKWYAKYIYRKQQWYPTGDSVNWNGSDLKIIADGMGFDGKLDGDTLSGLFVSRSSGEMVELRAKRLIDDIPF